MAAPDKSVEDILAALQERAKELACLYRVDEIMNRSGVPQDELLHQLIATLPAGWQYPEICQARLSLHEQIFEPKGFSPSRWSMKAPIVVQGERVGEIAIYYTEERPQADEGPFLKEERKLVNTIAERIGYYLMQKRLLRAFEDWETAYQQISVADRRSWNIILEFLRGTDPHMLLLITRKMINYLCGQGIREAEELLQRMPPDPQMATGYENRPQTRMRQDFAAHTEEAFRIASQHLSEDEIVGSIQYWIKEDRASFLVNTLEKQETTLSQVADALERYHVTGISEEELPRAVNTGLRVSLLRKFFTDQLKFIDTAKNFVTVEDFYQLGHRIIGPARSHGKLGGKSAGLFLACQIVTRSSEYTEMFGDIRSPKTWYVTSDGLLEFVHFNMLEDVFNRKYMEIDQIRREYPYVIQLFKNSYFPPDMAKGLSVALDDFEDRPLIVRSSSLLEDRMGTAFSGKYKSLFLANQGTKRERLAALQDAIAEVYASLFSPDPIEYRAERGLLDVHEEMGIMIQEVVGQRVGKYFVPAFAGVAFSNNEFRWSPRIRRKDGLVRLVPGLGTRAVDRLSDDYPYLAAPGQPALRVTTTPDEVAFYTPKFIDVINLEKNTFETVELDALLAEYGNEYPLAHRIYSKVEDGTIRKPLSRMQDFESGQWVANFGGLVEDTSFLTRLHKLMGLLEERLDTPVDIEFAVDADAFYLLQCRPQSFGPDWAPAPIPRNLPREQLVFSAKRHVSNGRVPDVTHIVYVRPEGYHDLEDSQKLKEVGRVIGRLNKLLPKRQFALLGPGRWGSRGDIKLGVSVTYSDINNTSLLVEIARRKGNYVPDLSFGTHFFQDLVEAGIRYLPLYPDEPDVTLNDTFLTHANNVLPKILPEFAGLADTVRVIDVPQETGGQVMKVLMNADLDEAVAVLADPSVDDRMLDPKDECLGGLSGNHWRWRLRMAEEIGAALEPGRFGVRAMYVIGSTKNATAGPGSDIDLLIHFTGTEDQRSNLALWMEGWSRCLAEINFLQTGYRARDLLDVHFITDDDIARRSSFACKIDAVTDSAKSIPLGRSTTSGPEEERDG
jgi:hypothetical protein